MLLWTRRTFKTWLSRSAAVLYIKSTFSSMPYYCNRRHSQTASSPEQDISHYRARLLEETPIINATPLQAAAGFHVGLRAASSKPKAFRGDRKQVPPAVRPEAGRNLSGPEARMKVSGWTHGPPAASKSSWVQGARNPNKPAKTIWVVRPGLKVPDQAAKVALARVPSRLLLLPAPSAPLNASPGKVPARAAW